MSLLCRNVVCVVIILKIQSCLFSTVLYDNYEGLLQLSCFQKKGFPFQKETSKLSVELCSVSTNITEDIISAT